MVKLTNKEHEQQQQNRIKKLENDLRQQKTRVERLEKRVDSLKDELSKHKAKPKR